MTEAVPVERLFSELHQLPDQLPAKRPTLQKVRYTHEAMIEAIINSGGLIKQYELAEMFGKTQSWISIILNSDAFKAQLAKRREEILDPELKASLKEKIEGLMARSLDLLMERLDDRQNPPSDQLILRSVELSSRAAGYGARIEVNNTVNVTQEITEHGDQLVGLLRRKKAEVLEGQAVEVSDEETQR